MCAYCDVCSAERDCRIVQRDETYPVKGELITVGAEVMVCVECGTDLFNAELDERNLELAFQEYRRRKGLLGRDDIVGIRGKYGLSQRSLATLLGWSPATVARYEMGALPSVPHNEQIRRFGDDVEYVKELFEARKDRLGQYARRKIEGKLSQLNSVPEEFLEKYILAKHSIHNDALQGRNEFDLDKTAGMMAFFASKMKDVTKTKMFKLVWYSDFLAYGRTLKSISGMVYCHNLHGPTPVAHDVLLAYMQSIGLIDLKSDASGIGESVDTLIAFDESMFSEEELRVLNDVYRKFDGFSATRTSDISHLEDGYVRTQMREVIPYDYAMSLKAVQ